MPHINGEGAIQRLSSRELSASNLTTLGFSRSIKHGLSSLFEVAYVLLVVTGPTGVG
jgi:type II secretory ATPase GspE/PulE/Tfp pilus assembly ATPase PilB-like protein